MFKTLFLALLMSVSGLAMADPQASRGPDFIILHKTLCSDADVLAVVDFYTAINPEQEPTHENWAVAETFIGGQAFKACYHVFGDNVHIVYDDGDQSTIPLSVFKEMGT